MTIGDWVKVKRDQSGKRFVGRICNIQNSSIPYPYEIRCFDGGVRVFRKDELTIISDGEAMLYMFEE
jgi:hypothetical protein